MPGKAASDLFQVDIQPVERHFSDGPLIPIAPVNLDRHGLSVNKIAEMLLRLLPKRLIQLRSIDRKEPDAVLAARIIDNGYRISVADRHYAARKISLRIDRRVLRKLARANERQKKNCNRPEFHDAIIAESISDFFPCIRKLSFDRPKISRVSGNRLESSAMQRPVKRLGLKDLFFGREGSIAVRVLCAIFGFGLTVFFRRIELYNYEDVPRGTGLIFVSNHPNALIDPALLFVALPRKIAFLAKSTLFKMPIIGWLVKTVGALPLYRQQDRGEDVSKNQKTFTMARELLKTGGAIALFPEGVSHNAPTLLPLKTGAARIAIGAVSSGSNPGSLTLRIVPVGLYYTEKTTFRSEALLYFGTAFEVERAELDENGQPPRDAVRTLTDRIESALREVTLNAESDARIAVAKIAEEVFTVTTPHEDNLAERHEFLKKFVAEPADDEDPRLEKRLEEYNRKLDELGIESEFLDLAGYSRRFVIRQAIKRSWYLFVFAPLVIFGTLLHLIPYRLGRLISSTQTRKGDHDMTSTVKLLTAMVFIPATWIVFAAVLAFAFSWLIAVVSIPVSALSGWVALRAIEEIDELHGWLRAIYVFFAKREKFLRLLAERRNLFDAVNR